MRPVRRTSAHMVNLHDSCRVNEYIATELVHIAAGRFEGAAAKQESQVDADRRWAIHVPPGAPLHPVRLVEDTIMIDQQWPGELGVAGIGHGHGTDVDGHQPDVDTQLAELLLVLSQLRQVFTAGQSPQVAVEYKEQPAVSIVLQTMGESVCVAQLKRGGWFS